MNTGTKYQANYVTVQQGRSEKQSKATFYIQQHMKHGISKISSFSSKITRNLSQCVQENKQKNKQSKLIKFQSNLNAPFSLN
jgi:hypothetical protein